MDWSVGGGFTVCYHGDEEAVVTTAARDHCCCGDEHRNRASLSSRVGKEQMFYQSHTALLMRTPPVWEEEVSEVRSQQ